MARRVSMLELFRSMAEQDTVNHRWNSAGVIRMISQSGANDVSAFPHLVRAGNFGIVYQPHGCATGEVQEDAL